MPAIIPALAILLTASAGSTWSDPSPHKSGFVTANGVRLHYLDWGGTGPAIILIHGYGLNAHYFDDLAPAFADRFRVIAYTRRGHGASESKGPFNSATFAEDLRGVMDALGIAKAHLAGHSMGGNEITKMAATHPERVDRLIYLDSAYDWADPAFVTAYHAVPGIYLNPPPDIAASLDRLRAHQSAVVWPAIEPSRLEACLRALVLIQPDGTLAGWMSESVRQQMEASLFRERRDYSKVRAPALAIYPETNLDVHFVSAAQAAENLAWEQKYMAPFRAVSIERVRRELPAVRIANVPGTHLDFLFTSHEKVVALIQRFLNRTS